MSARTPQIVTGPRGPRASRVAEAEAQARGGQAVAEIPSGKVQFQATAAKYRLQLASTEQKRGKDIIEKTRFVQFNNFVSPLYDAVKDEVLINEVKVHPAFTGEDAVKEIYDLAEVMKMARLETVRVTAERINSDPEFKAAILAALKASGDDDFEAPPSKE
jgi:hypothetical protein